MSKVLKSLRTAQEYAAANHELHAEYLRRSKAGEFFTKGEPVYKFMREFKRLNAIASKAACGRS